ncbi:helix-turn-helix domain-containing protein [Robiginitalea sediminis]|uniref:helix-turn-helix domain-containing protein n=1 Tax=Robiginitalea sediminis TaxID=1982593 RepID=UPI000B4C1A25|nr:helix-turn-helix domain-containing protein [Robiginitalea sediminis]
MKNLTHIERITRLHHLIRMEFTGTPGEIAERLEVSDRTVYYLLDQLRDYGAQIKYDRSRRTYFYEEEFILEVNFSICIGALDEVTEILEGSYLKGKRTSPPES